MALGKPITAFAANADPAVAAATAGMSAAYA
jgi:hypothetical protein